MTLYAVFKIYFINSRSIFSLITFSIESKKYFISSSETISEGATYKKFELLDSEMKLKILC